MYVMDQFLLLFSNRPTFLFTKLVCCFHKSTFFATSPLSQFKTLLLS